MQKNNEKLKDTFIQYPPLQSYFHQTFTREVLQNDMLGGERSEHMTKVKKEEEEGQPIKLTS